MTATQTRIGTTSPFARLRAIVARALRPADLTPAEAEAIGRGLYVTLRRAAPTAPSRAARDAA